MGNSKKNPGKQNNKLKLLFLTIPRNPNKNLGKQNKKSAKSKQKKQLISERKYKNSEIQTKIRVTQTQNRQNPNNKKLLFCLDFIPDYCLDFPPRFFRKSGKSKQKICFFIVWISPVLNFLGRQFKQILFFV
jgi:hypothetical protein